MRGGKIVERFVKEDNKHCFPIFPRWNPKTTQHAFQLEGWDYYMDCRGVKLRQLEIPQEPSSDLHSQESVHLRDVSVFERVTVQQVVGSEPLLAEVVS